MKTVRLLALVLSVVLVVSLSVSLQGGAAGPLRWLPLKVTFFDVDDDGNQTALRGRTLSGEVTYQDRVGDVEAYISNEGELYFRVGCARTACIDFVFSAERQLATTASSLDPSPEKTLLSPPPSSSAMTSFRMSNLALANPVTKFTGMTPGESSEYPLAVQFWITVDEYSWNLQYATYSEKVSDTRVMVTAGPDADAKGPLSWVITPVEPPSNPIGAAGVHFEKYVHPKRELGHTHWYGDWSMPFKIRLERLK